MRLVCLHVFRNKSPTCVSDVMRFKSVPPLAQIPYDFMRRFYQASPKGCLGDDIVARESFVKFVVYHTFGIPIGPPLLGPLM